MKSRLDEYQMIAGHSTKLGSALDTLNRVREERDRLHSENAELRTEMREILQIIRIKLGIRDDFVPLGHALELEPIIKKALVSVSKEPK